jgi:hypothetical protein
MCIYLFFLYPFFKTFLIVQITERDIFKNVYWSLCKVTAILFRFWWNLNFHDRLSKNAHISSIMKIRPIGAELFHTDKQTDGHDEANSRFPQFREGA